MVGGMVGMEPTHCQEVMMLSRMFLHYRPFCVCVPHCIVLNMRSHETFAAFTLLIPPCHSVPMYRTTVPLYRTTVPPYRTSRDNKVDFFFSGSIG